MAGVLPVLAYESVHRHKDGQAISVEIFLQLIRLQGQAPRFVSVVTDISERKQAQEEILRLNAELEEQAQQRTAQLQAANLELEAFSCTVSHQLRGPLTIIGGCSSLLAMKICASSATERGKNFADRISAEVLQMGELIDALLALAQFSRTCLRRENVDLSDLAETLPNAYLGPGRAMRLAV